MDGPGTYSQPPQAGGSKDESGTAAKDTISIGSGDRVSGADRMGMEVHTTYYEDYEVFCRNAVNDVENAKQTREYGLDMMNHPNRFDASYISWLSYDSLNVELPDGFLHFAPIVNWGKCREENGRLMMPVSVRLNHAIADGFLVANVYRLLEKEMAAFCDEMPGT